MSVEAADTSAVVLILRPQSGLGQQVRASHLSIEPDAEVREIQDAFGNLLQRTVLPRGNSVITSTCTVETPDEIAVEPNAGFTLISKPAGRCPPIFAAQQVLRIGQNAEISDLDQQGERTRLSQAEAIRSWIFRK